MRFYPLLLVFALAATANATVSLHLDDSPAPPWVEILMDEVLTIQVHSDNADSYLGYIIKTGAGSLYNLRKIGGNGIGPYPAAVGAIEPDWDGGFELVMVATPDNPVTPGIHFLVDYSSAEEGTAVAFLFTDPDYEAPADSISIMVVPEPVTVMLLGLGTLAVLRKHRTV